jgi:hypothetical protein
MEIQLRSAYWVGIGEHGIAIFNPKTLKQLPIERDERVQKIIEEAFSL